MWAISTIEHFSCVHATKMSRDCHTAHVYGGIEIHYGTRSDQTELSSGSRARYMVAAVPTHIYRSTELPHPRTNGELPSPSARAKSDILLSQLVQSFNNPHRRSGAYKNYYCVQDYPPDMQIILLAILHCK